MKYIKTYEVIYLSRTGDIDNKELLDSVRDGNLDMLKKLLMVGTNINTQNPMGNTPLMLAVKLNRVKILKELIKQRANLNLVNNGGSSALISAAHHKFSHNKLTEEDILIIKMLIEAGSDWNIKDNIGQDFLDHFTNQKIKNSIIKQYPTQYKEYLLKKSKDKFNI
jgi:ankyrin repeat protein